MFEIRIGKFLFSFATQNQSYAEGNPLYGSLNAARLPGRENTICKNQNFQSSFTIPVIRQISELSSVGGNIIFSNHMMIDDNTYIYVGDITVSIRLYIKQAVCYADLNEPVLQLMS